MLLHEELVYDREALKEEDDVLIKKLIHEQMHVYDTVISDVNVNGGGLFFVYDYGGKRKT